MRGYLIGDMIDLDCKSDMVSSSRDMHSRSPKVSKNLKVSISQGMGCFSQTSPAQASSSDFSSYEHYIRLIEMKRSWKEKRFPNWKNELILKPALNGLEITFRLISSVYTDPRVYTNRREWMRKAESLCTNQIQLISILLEEDDSGAVPIVDSRLLNGVLARGKSSTEVWKMDGDGHGDDETMVNGLSEESLLPRLASWDKTEGIAQKIVFSIECEMRRCPFTLGLGEPNFRGKPNLDYDAICKPSVVHSLRKMSGTKQLDNHENEIVFTTHQILECWISSAAELLHRLSERMTSKDSEKASADCWLLERVWRLLADIEDLHLLLDPDDFLRLKNQLAINETETTVPPCFRSRGLVQITKQSKELKHRVPQILLVEVDPKGGPRIQEAAMKLYREKRDFSRIHLLQALQAVESAMKRFYFAYRQVMAIVMGSLEVKGNRVLMTSDSCDSLSRIFLEPTYFPSLDAAKTFLADFWEHEYQRPPPTSESSSASHAAVKP